RLFLLDGTALAYRSFFAFIRNPLFDGKGRNVSAVYGFTSTLFKLLETERPERIGVAFDPPGPTFRHERYKEYKATRQKMPDEMAESLPAIHDIVAAFRIPIFELPGYEADDVLGTLAVRGAAAGLEVMLVTGDKDLTQLVTDRVRIYNVFTRGGEPEVLGPAEVRAKFGVGPEQVVDFLGLTGDTSDNIPGVPGIGEKTATALLAEFGSLDALLDRAAEVKGKRPREGLLANRERALLSRELARIRTDVPVVFDLDAVRVGKRDEARLVVLFREYQLNSFLPRLKPEAAPVERRYRTVTSKGELAELIALLSSVPRFVLDTETTGLDPLRADLVGLSFSVRAGEATYVPMNLDPPFLPREEILGRLRPVLEDPAIGKAGQNIKYDLKVLGRTGLEAGPVCFDTMVASFLLDPAHREHNLDALAMVHLNLRKIPTTDIIGKGKDQITMADAPVEKVAEYACEDAEVTWRLMELFEPRLAALGLDRLNREVEVPLVEVLARMERAGVLLDLPVLERMSTTMAGEIARLEDEIQRLAGVAFNVNSPPQLGAVLFETLKIHEGRTGRARKPKTTSASGQYATDQETLEAYADHPIVRKIFEYREYVKLKGTYVDALPALVNPETGRVHANYHQAVAVTGRLSATDPNLQNIPIRTEVGREIRTAFIAPPGSVLFSADYSQIELRVLAHLSGDETLCSAFREGKDIHTDTAARIFGFAPELVTSELRGRAKAINFGIVYGMGPQRLSRQTGMSLPEAREFIEAYFRTYPRVKEFQEECRRQAREEGFVQTLLGRRRNMKDEINSADGRVKANAENIAINTPIQGTAADLIKVAMIRIDARLRRERLRTRMIIQVHDELVLEVPEDERESARALVRAEMEGALTLAVPIAVGLGEGPNWLAAH
ncbi:MAG: DNA polymerase I, partial [Planctomycetes bacterium]|nr:DNA polymerase I [Planctomycetota bacterium]